MPKRKQVVVKKSKKYLITGITLKNIEKCGKKYEKSV